MIAGDETARAFDPALHTVWQISSPLAEQGGFSFWLWRPRQAVDPAFRTFRKPSRIHYRGSPISSISLSVYSKYTPDRTISVFLRDQKIL
jgi:hypothetical protein